MTLPHLMSCNAVDNERKIIWILFFTKEIQMPIYINPMHKRESDHLKDILCKRMDKLSLE